MRSNNAIVNEGLKRLRLGRQKYERVRDLLPFLGPAAELHAELRECHRILRSAMNYLEDTPRFDVAHRLLDDAGRLARERFALGCEYPYEDGTYYVRCPVSLAHNRVGLSIAMVIEESHCSICKLDPEDCPHVTGGEYEGQECYQVVTKVGRILDVSLVGRPNMPDARIESMSMEETDLRRNLGSAFYPGVPVTCNQCLKPCEGVARPFEQAGH
jgi:hypothetical protein